VCSNDVHLSQHHCSLVSQTFITTTTTTKSSFSIIFNYLIDFWCHQWCPFFSNQNHKICNFVRIYLSEIYSLDKIQTCLNFQFQFLFLFSKFHDFIIQRDCHIIQTYTNFLKDWFEKIQSFFSTLYVSWLNHITHVLILIFFLGFWQ
jgi:hypothetical protein